jgi:hypothetical protein
MSSAESFTWEQTVMQAEYAAWQAVNAECKRLGIDMNLHQYDRLIKAICVWGERLYTLRSGQTPEQVKAALGMYLSQYEEAKQADK